MQKDVIVLLDTGNSMGDNVPSDLLVQSDISKLSAASSIVTQLLDTFAYGDRVTIITFTSSGAQIVLSPVSNIYITLVSEYTLIKHRASAFLYEF